MRAENTLFKCDTLDTGLCMKYNSYIMREVQKPYKMFFETLGNVKRWEIVRLLEKGPQGATDIARNLSHEQSLISHHLRRLEDCGFIHVKQSGKRRVYTLNAKTMRPLLKLMHTHIHAYCATRGRCICC